jgi:hypothetical protein
MGILDEAIREHLELKRQHGADEPELKKLEDEAFGQAERPGGEAASDVMDEAPTEFMAQPDVLEEPGGRREPTIADLQEPPPPPMPEPAPKAEEEEEPAAEGPPAEEEQPAMEHEIVADVPERAESEADAPEPVESEADIAEPEPAGPSTEERQVIAEQPTELFDVPEEIAAAPAPSDEELADEEAAEPRLGPAEPLADLEEDGAAEVTIQRPAPDDDEEYEDEDDAFWNEQRLSDELDQALEGPSDPEPVVVEDPDSGEEVLPIPEDRAPAEPDDAEPADDQPEPAPSRHDDVLDETPDFLEEAPEDDQLWFEQKPPKDFDFDD